MNIFEAHGAYRYGVFIQDLAYAAFASCKLPNLQLETMDIVEGGLNEYVHKLPVRLKPGSLTLQHGLTHRIEFLQWYALVVSGDIRNAMREVSVVIYDVRRRPVITFAFQRAYPVNWVGPTFKADDKSVAIEELEIVFHGFEIQS